MPHTVTRAVYKPDSQSTDEFSVIVADTAALARWKEDKSVPLVEVVDSFDIFFSFQGNQGQLGKASKQQLETVFGTSKDVDVVIKMLSEGKIMESKAVGTGKNVGEPNSSRGSGNVGAQGGR